METICTCEDKTLCVLNGWSMSTLITCCLCSNVASPCRRCRYRSMQRCSEDWVGDKKKIAEGILKKSKEKSFKLNSDDLNQFKKMSES